ncbi:MAG: GNAT family N-acetyltransferase [Acidimicrobiia bacterium]|nr:GNAT family N-acetyltransferase [Acidimicrobiia bacterium]
MRVRRGRHEDLLAIGRLAEAGFWDGYTGLLRPETIGRMLSAAYSPTAVSRRLLRGGVVVAEGDAGLAGFIDAISVDHGMDVSVIAIDPGFRRRGIGRALVEEATEPRQTAPLCADVLLGNLEAESFFERLGFVPGEVVPGAWFDEEVVERRWWLEARRIGHSGM